MNVPTLSLVVLVVLLVVGWFAAGTQFNVRRGHKALEWLQPGLKLLSEKTTLRWLGSSVVELKMANAREPFRRCDVLVVLEPRDVSFLWLFARLRNRRDLLIVRGVLHQAPRSEFEVFDPKSWSAQGLEARLQHRNWDPVSVAPPLLAYAAGGAPGSEISGLISLPGLVRLALHRTEPHFELQCRLLDIQKQPAQDLMQKLRAVVPAVARASRS